MSELIIACLMWALVLVLSFRVRTRPDNTMFLAAVVIASSLTTNIDALYLWASSWLPWPNILDLAGNALLIVGVYYLSRAISQGATRAGANAGRRIRWTRRAARATIVIMACAFILIDDPTPSTRFMTSYGHQGATAIYSGVQYLYIFAVMAGTLFTCIKNVPRMRQGRFRLAFRIIGAGCVSALLLCVSVIVMDVGHVLGANSLVHHIGSVYDSLNLVTMALLCVGLGIPPLKRVLSTIGLRRQVLVIEPKIRRIWLSTVAKNPAVSLVGSTAISPIPVKGLPTSVATDGIHRMVIEIHDWINVNRCSRDAVSAGGWEILREAESLCLQQGKVI